MTKIIDLTKEAKEEKELKPIEFVTFLCKNGINRPAEKKPNEYKNIEIAFRIYEEGLALMIAYNKDKSFANFYLGFINDGIV